MENTSIKSQLGLKVRDYIALTKPRLSLSVVFSACTAFYLGSDNPNLISIFTLGLGGFLVTGSANTLNQIIEKDTDKLMDRTKNRPIASNRLDVSESIIFSGIVGVIGILLLSNFNYLSAVLGAISLISYAFIYTPLKKLTPASVWVGAIPGALPMSIGWCAATNDSFLSNEALFLFTLQFIWQFPHFWAIAWITYDDYAKGGFYLLPTGRLDGRNKSTSIQIIFYIVCLMVLSFVPLSLGISSYLSFIVMILAALFFMSIAVKLYVSNKKEDAKKLMLGSLVYQLVVFITLIIDKQ